MKPSGEPTIDAVLAEIAAPRYGLIPMTEARAAGATTKMIRSRVQSGRLVRIWPGVYLVNGSPPSWRRSLLAACLAAGEGAVVSCFAAAGLWRLPDLVAGRIEITVPRSLTPRLAGVRIHRPLYLPAVDVTVVDGIPVTTLERTVIDIANSLDDNLLDVVLDEVLQSRGISLARMRWRLDDNSANGRRATRRLRKALDARDPRVATPESPLERRFLRALREDGLPEPVPQFPIRTDHGILNVDFAYIEERVAIEVDGYAFHAGRHGFENDRDRGNALAALGWQRIQVTARALERNRTRLMTRIRLALEAGRADDSSIG